MDRKLSIVTNCVMSYLSTGTVTVANVSVVNISHAFVVNAVAVRSELQKRIQTQSVASVLEAHAVADGLVQKGIIYMRLCQKRKLLNTKLK